MRSSNSWTWILGTWTVGLVAFVFTLGMSVEASAQAWIAGPGSGYAELGVRTISGDQFFNSEGEVQDIASAYSQTSVNFYGQVGVVERWLQLTASGELFRRNELEDQGATSGLGDLIVGAWTGLLQGDYNLALGVEVGLPTGDADPGEGIEDPQARIIASSLPTGDGEVDVAPMLAFGFGFGGESWPLVHYVTASAGYHIRTQGFQNGLKYGFELGSRLPVSFMNRVWLATSLSGLEPLGEPSGTGFTGLGSGVTYTAFGVSLSVDIWRGFGLRAGFESAFRAKKIIAAAPLNAAIYGSF